MGGRLRYSDDWGLELEADFESYMLQLEANVEDPTLSAVLDETGNYFCGCVDCYRRAEWSWLMKRTIRAYQAGDLRLEEDPTP